MNQRHDNVSINIFEKINSICREFRDACRSNARPKLKQWLIRVGADSRDNLFQNLLEIELNYRRSRGESPSSEEYVSQFPDYKALVRHAFFQPTLMSMEELHRTPADSAVDDLQTRTFEYPAANRLGDYELIRELGRGGFGVVYEARHIKRDNRVALKTLPTGTDGQEQNAERLYRFRKEFRSLSEINHPNLVGMQTLEVDGGQWFFTMDLIDGDDFLSHVGPHGQLNEDRLRETLRQLAMGIMALHGRGIIHRDLKPSNVMVEANGRVLILDFGLVAELQTAADLTVSRSGMFAGTPRYAAPEQMFGQRSEASDWYALGVMLYEALTAEPPFVSKNPIELMRQKQNEDPASLVGRDDLPGDLASLADSLLRRNPRERIDPASIGTALDLDIQSHSSGSRDSSDNRTLDVESTLDNEPILIGRDLQLADLKAAGNDILKYLKPIIVFITGRSGEGKSSLADTFLRPLRHGKELVVLTGRCYDRESVPFKVIDALIDQLVTLLRSRDASEIASLLPTDIAFLAHLFPVLRRVPTIEIQSSGQILGINERQIKYRAFGALRELLGNISKRKPIILFVDDLQWGDADSADVLRDLIAPPEPPAIMFLGSYRSDEADDSDFLRNWSEFAGETPALEPRIIKVEPLSEDQCLAFLETRFADAPFDIRQQAHDLFQNTRGNPYFLEQLIQGYDPETKTFEPVPLNEIIGRKLQALPENALSLLKIIAVSGKALPVSEVASLAGKDTSAFGTVTHMRSESLVRMIGSSDVPSVDTYHDKIRETVLAELSTDEKREQHLSFGEFIEQEEGLVGRDMLQLELGNTDERSDISVARLFDLAFHFYEAQDARAFAYQLLAGESSSRSFAFESAIEHLNKAKTLLPADADARLRFRLWERMASVYSRLNKSEQAFEYYTKASSDATDPRSRSVAQFGIGMEHKNLGYIAKSLKHFGLALNELDIKTPRGPVGYVLNILSTIAIIALVPSRWQKTNSADDASQARLASEICYATTQSASDKGALELAHAALFAVRLALKSGSGRLTAFSYSQLAGQFAWAGMTRVSKACMRRSARAAITGDDIELLAISEAWEGVAASNQGSYGPAIEILERAIELSIKCGDNFHAAGGASILCHTLGIASRASQEMSIGKRHIEIAEECGDRRSICWGEYCYSHALARAGKLSEAHQYMDRTLSFYQDETTVLTESVGRSMNAFVLLQSSQYSDAQRQAAMGWEIAERKKVFIVYLVRNLPWLMESLAGAQWMATDTGLDRNYARSLCGRSARFEGYLMLTAQISRSRGRLHCRLGKPGKAIKCFEKSIRTARKQGIDFELAKGLLDLAAIQEQNRESHRREAVELLKKMESVIPFAESWLLGDQYDEAVVAPEFDLEAWEREHGSVTSHSEAKV